MIKDVSALPVELAQRTSAPLAEFVLRAVFGPCFIASRWLLPRRTSLPEDGPPARLSVAVATKVVLDELFFLTEVLSARIVTGADGGRLAEEVGAALICYEKHGWLADPASFHQAPTTPSRFELRWARALHRRYQHLTFESGYAPHVLEPGRERWLGQTANRAIHAWVLEHAGGPRPWIVCLPGYRSGHPLVDFAQFPPSWLHHQLGMNVLVPVLPLHGPRRAGRRSGDGLISGDLLDAIHTLAQAVWDVRRLLRWLAARDAPAIGLYGLSLGGTTAALVASLESDLQCVIAGMPAHDLVGLARNHVPAFLLARVERSGIAWKTIERILRVVSPLALTPRIDPACRFLFGGVADRLVPPAQLAALWRHWERPRIMWHDGSHVSFSIEPSVREFVTEALAASGMVVPAAGDSQPTVGS